MIRIVKNNDFNISYKTDRKLDIVILLISLESIIGKNFIAVFEVLEREKGNQTIKGDLIKSAFLTSTMGVSYRLKLPKSI